MEQADLERVRNMFDREVREQLQGAQVRTEVLQYGDAPEIEPGQLTARIVLDAPDDPVERMRTFKEFSEAHRGAVSRLREALDALPANILLQVVASSGDVDAETGPRIQLLAHGGGPGGPPTGLIPLDAWVAPEDLETLDTLIGAGIGTSRAEAVRWALARIRTGDLSAESVAIAAVSADISTRSHVARGSKPAHGS
jgi:hypothetical protein